MITLATKTLYLPPQPVPQSPPAQAYSFVKPLSYEFRVAEHVDNEHKVHKVGLQVQVWEHDEYGSGTLKQSWTDVERVQVPFIG